MSYPLRARRARFAVARLGPADFRDGPGRRASDLRAGGAARPARSARPGASSAAKLPREAFNAVARAASPLTKSPQRSSCPLRLPLSVNFNPSGDTARMKVLPPRVSSRFRVLSSRVVMRLHLRYTEPIAQEVRTWSSRPPLPPLYRRHAAVYLKATLLRHGAPAARSVREPAALGLAARNRYRAPSCG